MKHESIQNVNTLSLLFLRNCPCLLFWHSSLYSPSRQLRSSSDSRTLRIPHVRMKIFGNHSFSYAAPSAWNSLPREIRYIQSTTAFKTALKTNLFQSYYHWQTLYPLHSPLLTVFVDFFAVRAQRVCVCVWWRLFAAWFSLLFTCFLYSMPSSGFALEFRTLQVSLLLLL